MKLDTCDRPFTPFKVLIETPNEAELLIEAMKYLISSHGTASPVRFASAQFYDLLKEGLK